MSGMVDPCGCSCAAFSPTSLSDNDLTGLDAVPIVVCPLFGQLFFDEAVGVGVMTFFLKSASRIRLILGGLALVATQAFLSAAHAGDEIPAAQGPVVLRVTGQISATQAGAAEGEPIIELDRAGLEQLPWQSVEGFSAWTEGKQRFEGVLLRDLLDYVGVEGQDIRAIALNDYAANLPVSDAYAFDVLLVMRIDGADLRVRDKGPIWIVYPEPQPAEVHTSPHNEKMVWQLATLEIR